MAVTSIEVATGNPGKVAEIRDIISSIFPDLAVNCLSLALPEVQPTKEDLELLASGDYIKVGSRITGEKARAAYHASHGKSVLVEDTMLVFPGLEGRPGPLIASFVTKRWIESWITLIKGCGDNSAVTTVTYGYSKDGTNFVTTTGVVEGVVATSPRGTKGFGWDSIFIPEPVKQKEAGVEDLLTYAEMELSVKRNFSARSRALRSMVAKLRET